MTGDTAEIMKKNASRQGEPHQGSLVVSSHGEALARTTWGEQHLPGGPFRQARFPSSITARQVPCGSISGSLAIPLVPPWVTANVCQSPRNATLRVSLF